MIDFGPNIDLEKPYADQCEREDRFRENVSRHMENIWYELTDESDVEKFVYDNIANPEKLLIKLFHRIALTKQSLERLRQNNKDMPTAQLIVERDKIKREAYIHMSHILMDEIEKAAEGMAENE